MRRWTTVLGLTLLAAGTLLAGTLPGCGSTGPETAPATAAARPTQVVLNEKGEPLGLAHHHRWSEKIGQSGEPTGDVAFANAAALGYHMIISVDGARPDAEAAAKYGLRYVHVPIEYSGITRDQALRVVKAVELSDGPVLIHCHHGLHRGPVGAMTARIALDGISNDEAVEELKESGCSAKYEGLYRDIAAFRPPTAEELAAVSSDLPAFVSAGDTVDHMAKLSRVFEGLASCQKAAWGVPADSPDVSPPHQARILWEHFRELQRMDESKAHGEQYMQWLAQTEQAATQLEEAIRAGDRAASDAAMGSVKDSCSTCHKKYRDN